MFLLNDVTVLYVPVKLLYIQFCSILLLPVVAVCCSFGPSTMKIVVELIVMGANLLSALFYYLALYRF